MIIQSQTAQSATALYFDLKFANATTNASDPSRQALQDAALAVVTKYAGQSSFDVTQMQNVYESFARATNPTEAETAVASTAMNSLTNFFRAQVSNR